ncbi:MAG: hypothetical protein M3Z46_01285, partial [Actinomycetota bacterium]|nr:hypothetical protein [Actinomycetota bacterium]
MAKGSSARKVARVAASSGGARAHKQRNVLFPAAIALIVAAGLLLVIFARGNNQSASANNTPPRASVDPSKPSDHWHAAFAVNICGKEQPPVQDGPVDTLGIHTHGDGVIHIHPFVTRAAGKGATLGRFFTQVGLSTTDTSIRMPDKKIYQEGKTNCNGKPGVVSVAFWKVGLKAAKEKPDKVYTSDFSKVRFLENYEAFTLAFLPEGQTAKAPSTAPNLIELGAKDGSGTGGVTPSSAVTPGSS